MKPGFLLSLFLLSLSLPDPAGQLLLVCAAAVPIVYLRRRQASIPLTEGAHIAAWVYENVAGHRERQTILKRLSGTELAALLDSCSQLHQVRHRAPTNRHSDDNASLVVNELRRHRIQELQSGQDKEAVSRFVRAVETNSPALPPGEHALTEMTRLASNHPDLIVQVLRDWILLPNSLQRFRAARKGAPALTASLIQTYHLDLDHPSLAPAEEVSTLLSLLQPELREAYRSELPTLPTVFPTRFDQEFVARKFVARVWSKMSVSCPLPMTN